MIIFGLPEPAAHDAAKAAECIVRLFERTKAWRATLPSDVSSRLGYKIGGHYGTVVASRLGGESHQQIAATGDTVNVANRLMEVAAEHHATVAVSDDLLRTAGNDSRLHQTGALVGPIEAAIRGRSGSVSVWLWNNGAELAG